eukprot:gene7217-324_t
MSLLMKSNTLQAKAVARPARSVRMAARTAGQSWFPGADLPAHLDGTMTGDFGTDKEKLACFGFDPLSLGTDKEKLACFGFDPLSLGTDKEKLACFGLDPSSLGTDKEKLACFGFDPLSLGTDKEKLAWYVQAELQNGRWAMMGVAGILFTELVGPTGVAGPAAATPWYKAGEYEYFASAQTLVGLQMLLFAWVEFRRYGAHFLLCLGIFDPLGFSKGDLAALKVKEIKNARLAMCAFAGFMVQYAVTGMGPVAAITAHLDDPFNTTVWSNKAHIPL